VHRQLPLREWRGCSEKGSLWAEDALLPAVQHGGTSAPKPAVATHVCREITHPSLGASPKTNISDAQKHCAGDVRKPALTLT